MVQGNFKQDSKVRCFSRELRRPGEVRFPSINRRFYLIKLFQVLISLFVLTINRSQLQIRNICRTAAANPATHQGNQSPSVSASCNEPRPCVTYTRNKGAASQPQGLRPLPPPELPPRTASPASGISSSWHGQGESQSQAQSQASEQPLGVNPLGRSHSAVMTSSLG